MPPFSTFWTQLRTETEDEGKSTCKVILLMILLIIIVGGGIGVGVYFAVSGPDTTKILFYYSWIVKLVNNPSI